MKQLTMKWNAKLCAVALGMAALTLSACDTPMGGGNVDPNTTAIETPIVTTTETLTNTEGMGDVGAITGTETMTDSGMMTGTATPATSDMMTNTMPGTGAMTDTGSITDTGMMTDTGAMSGAGTTGSWGVVNAEGALATASQLLDYDFDNIDGEVSGEIEDLLIDTATGRVLFATLEYGGFLDIGDTELPVPLSAFTWDSENGLVLNFNEEVLQNMPDVGQNWPNVDDGAWDDELNQFWNDLGFGTGDDVTEASNTIVRASTINGYPIADLGVGAGAVNDLIIDLGTSQVKYAVVSYGAATMADEWILVPFSAFDANAFGDEFAYSTGIDLATLDEAPRVDRDLLYSVTPIDSTLDDQMDTFWDERGFEVERD